MSVLVSGLLSRDMLRAKFYVRKSQMSSIYSSLETIGSLKSRSPSLGLLSDAIFLTLRAEINHFLCGYNLQMMKLQICNDGFRNVKFTLQIQQNIDNNDEFVNRKLLDG